MNPSVSPAKQIKKPAKTRGLINAEIEEDFVLMGLFLDLLCERAFAHGLPCEKRVRDSGETPNGLSASETLRESHLVVYYTLVCQASSYTPVEAEALPEQAPCSPRCEAAVDDATGKPVKG